MHGLLLSRWNCLHVNGTCDLRGSVAQLTLNILVPNPGFVGFGRVPPPEHVVADPAEIRSLGSRKQRSVEPVLVVNGCLSFAGKNEGVRRVFGAGGLPPKQLDREFGRQRNERNTRPSFRHCVCLKSVHLALHSQRVPAKILPFQTEQFSPPQTAPV